MLVVNEKIHPARDVTKRISVRVETWDSGDIGVLGLVDTDQVTFYNQPVYKHTTRSDVRLPPNITQPVSYRAWTSSTPMPERKALLIDAAVKRARRRSSSPAFPPAPARRCRRAAQPAAGPGLIVIMSNRGGLGRISTANEYISADNLSPQKARVLAMLALAKNPSPAFVAQVLATH